MDASIPSTSQPTSAVPLQRIFYNRKPHFQWFGILILRDDPGHYWHIYAQTETRLKLLVQHLKRDLLLLHCNVSVLEINECITEPDNIALELEASLREELLAWKELLDENNQDYDYDEDVERYKLKLSHIHKLQLASDVLATMLKKQNAQNSEN